MQQLKEEYQNQQKPVFDTKQQPVILEEKNLENQLNQREGNSQLQRQKRRTRNDNNNRNYNCGCGKSYLSYPALYTHLKQKHDGKPPQGTSLPQNNQKSNRGRPKVKNKNEDEKQNKDQDKQLLPYEQNYVIEELLAFLDTIGKDYRRDNQKENDNNSESDENNHNDNNQQNSNSNSNQKNGQYILNIFPKQLFTNVNDYNTLLQNIEKILTQDIEVKEEEFDSEKDIKKCDLNKIFAYFILSLQNSLNDQALKEMIIFICLYRKALNEYGWESLNQTDIKKDQTKEFCQDNNGENAILICNDFIIDILPHYLSEFSNIDQFEIIGITDEKIKNSVFLLQHFSNWLFANKYTNSKLLIMTEDNE